MARVPVVAWLASSEQASYEAARAGDGLALAEATYRWASANGAASVGAPHWLRADVGTAQVVTWYQISPSMYQVQQDPVAWTFEGSNDASAWTVLDTKAAQTWSANECKTITFANSTAYRYYRVNVTANGGSLTSISELVLGGGDPPSRLMGWGPATSQGNGTFTLGVEFYPLVDGYITRLTYLEYPNAAGTFTLRLYGPTGTLLATATDTAVSGRFGWREVPITPVAVTAGTHYEATQYFVGTYFSMVAQTFTTAKTYNDLVVVANGLGTIRGVTHNPRYANGDAPTVNAGSPYAQGVVFVRTVETEPVLVKTYQAYTELAARGIPKAKTYASYLELASRGAPRAKTLQSYLEVIHRADAPPRTDITQFPIISEIRAEDHTAGALSTLIDRRGDDWVPHGNGTGAVSAVTAATPNGSKALSFVGGVGWSKPLDVGLLYQYGEVEKVFCSTIFNNWQGDYGPQTVLGTPGNFSCQTFTGSPEWWGVKLKNARVLTEYSIQHSGNGSNSRNARDWTFQGSNDSTTGADGTWTTLDTRTGQNTDALTAYTFTNSTAYRWYRIRVTAINGGQMWFMTRVELQGLPLLGLQAPAAEQWFVVKSTVANSGHPAHANDVGPIYFPFGDGQIYSGWGTAGRANYTPTVPVLNQWRIYRLRRNGGTTSEYLDNVLQINMASGTFFRQPRIGGITAQIAASIVLDQALSTADANFLYNYLRDAYFTIAAAPVGIFVGWGKPRGVGGAPVVDNDYAIAVKAGQPTMYLQMNEGAGTTATDSSGNGHDATLTAPAALETVSGMVGSGALNVNGGYAVVPYGSWMAQEGFTYEAIIKSTETGVAAWQHIVDRDSGVGGRVFQWAILGNGAMQVKQTTAGTKFGLTVFAPAGSVPINAKAHVAFSYARDRITLFVNGVEVATDTGFVLSGSSALAIGRGYGSGSTPIASSQFVGRIDEVVFHPRPLSAAEILARVPLAVPPTPPVIAAAGILWLHNKELGAAGSTVSSWPDASPAARSVTYAVTVGNATVAAASTPNGGKSVALPGGTGGPAYTIGASALATNRDGEVWMVLKSNDTGGNGSSKWGGDAGQMNHYGYGGSVYDDTGATSRINAASGVITSFHIYRVQTLGTARTVWNGTTVVWGPGAVTPFWRQSPIVGGQGNPSYFFNGNIAEVIQFSRALTVAEADAIHAYLQLAHFV